MTTDTPIIYVVDDDASFLKALSRLLQGCGFEVKVFSTAFELLSQVSRDTHGCIIADLRMPGLSGLELQETLIQSGISVPVIFLTGAGDIPSSVCAMRQGAEDFLSKTAPKDELLDVVRRAIARDAKEHAERARLQSIRQPFDSLTRREREVLSHVLLGRLNKEIAHDLKIDERSVKRHRTNLMTKLQVDSVAELIHLVHDAGLYEPNNEASPTRGTFQGFRP